MLTGDDIDAGADENVDDDAVDLSLVCDAFVTSMDVELTLSVVSLKGLESVGESGITVCCELRRMLIDEADGGASINLLISAESGTDFLNMPMMVLGVDRLYTHTDPHKQTETYTHTRR